MVAWAWFTTGFLQPHIFLARAIRDPYPGETISHYLGLEILNITVDAEDLNNDAVIVDDLNNSNSSATKTDTAELHNRDNQPVPWKPEPVIGKPLLYKPAQAALSATYNATGDRGYNITIPSCTPADSVLGDWEAPSGDVIENCTLAQMSQKLNLPSATLLNFTKSRAGALLAKLTPILENGVCEPPLEPPDRELKANPRPGFRFDPDTQKGYFSSLLLIMAGSFGLSFTGLHLGIIHEGLTANISATTEVLILATFASFGTTCVVIVERERMHIGRAEAIVLNAFIKLGEKIYDSFHSNVQCIQENQLAQGVRTLVDKLNQGAQVLVRKDVQAAAMSAAGSSSVNLVSHGDVENQLTNGQCGH